MTTWQLIRTMVQKGYMLECGRHFKGYRGYWARFLLTEHVEEAPECDECEQPILVDRWEQAGHALTPHRAVIMAAKIALGKLVTVPPSEEFKL